MAVMEVARGRKYRIDRDPAWVPGRHVAVITAHDQYYEDNVGALQPITEDLETDGADGFAQKADKANHKVRFATNGTRRWYPRRNVDTEYIEFGRPEYWNGSIWQVLPLGTPVRAGRTYTWDRPNYTLQVAFTWRRLKFDITLKSAAAAKRFRWPVSLTGLTRTGWELFGADATKIGVIDKPTAMDAVGLSIPVTASVVGGYVEFDADLTGATFPVTIDPTLDSQPDGTDGKDAGISLGSPTTNDATGTTLATGVSGTTNTLRFLMEFDCSSIPAGSVCNSAVLTLGAWFFDANTRAHTCYQLLSGRDGWVESEVTWNIWSTGNNWGTAGAANTSSDRSATALGTFTTASAPADVTCNFNTTQVAGWFGGTNTNYGFVCQQDNEAQDFTKNEFLSSDHGTAGTRPQLVIDYTVAADIDQEGFRFREDDGSESAATWAGAQDANIAKPSGSALRLRMLLDTPDDPGSQQYRLDYKKSTDSVYLPVEALSAAALAYGAEGALAYSAASGTTVSPVYPTGITTKSILLMVVGQKPTTAGANQVTTPSGWTLIGSLIDAGGYGATLGADTGNTNLYIFAKDTVAGTETGTVAVTITNMSTTGITWAQILRIESNIDLTRDYAVATTSRTTTPTSPMTLTFGSDPGVTAGDYVIAAMCIPTDVTTPAQFSSQVIAQTGVTFGAVTEISEPDASTGNDIGGVIVRAAVSSGTGSAAPTLQMTLAGTLTNVRGPAIFVRVRAIPVIPPIQLELSANISASAATATTALLTPPSGKTTGDFDAGKISDDTNPLPTIDIAAAGYTELEWSIKIDDAAINDDIYQFRVTVGGVALFSYTLTPELTVGSGVINASATFAGIGTLAAGTILTSPATVTLVAAGVLTAGTPRLLSSAASAGTAALTTTPVFKSSAALAGAGVLAIGNVLLIAPSIAANGIAALVVSNPRFNTAATMAGAGLLAASSPVILTSVTAAGIGTASATASLITPAAATFAGVALLSAGVPELVAPSTTFTGAGLLNPGSPLLTGDVSAIFAGTSTVSTGTPILIAPAVASAGASTLNATPVFSTSATFAGTAVATTGNLYFIAPAIASSGLGSLAVEHSYNGPAGAVVNGVSSLSVNGYLTTPAGANFAATGSLAVNGTLTTPRSVTLAGGAVASFGAIQIIARAMAASGLATVSAAALQYVITSVTVAGAGVLNPGAAVNTYQSSAAFSGASTLSAVPESQASASVTFTGSSVLIPTANYGILITSGFSVQGISTFTAAAVYAATFRAYASADAFNTTFVYADVFLSAVYAGEEMHNSAYAAADIA